MKVFNVKAKVTRVLFPNKSTQKSYKPVVFEGYGHTCPKYFKCVVLSGNLATM